ncbi:MAG: ZIP family metal transporter [Candidatus Aenigmarchaeota archaeon]|nr:ZIP family metal transporter [Candidatus Aenigmarchaeota archaeon]
MTALIYTLVSVIIISLVSLVGIFTFLFKKERMTDLLLFLVSFSAGSLLGGAFLHLLPETAAEFGFGVEIGAYAVSGMVLFFILEKFIHWRHCHIPTSSSHPHSFAYMNLVGDSLHNLIDGLVIGASYLVSIPLGVATSLAVLFHEIPQEMGDFGVLVHGGFKKKRALILNFLTALTAVIGAVIGIALGGSAENFIPFILPFTAGGFLYIAGSDLIPELHKECRVHRSLVQLIGIILGIAVMMTLLFI